MKDVEQGAEQDGVQGLDRPQRRLLRRIFNGRTVPLVVAGQAFLTYKDASRHLLSLTPDARAAAYTEIRRQAQDAAAPPG